MNDINPTAKSILNTALNDVKQEVSILVDDSVYLVYIQDIKISNGQLEMMLSTPHDLDPEMKERIYGFAYDAVRQQLQEGNTECQSRNLFSLIYSSMRNIFAKFFRS